MKIFPSPQQGPWPLLGLHSRQIYILLSETTRKAEQDEASLTHSALNYL